MTPVPQQSTNRDVHFFTSNFFLLFTVKPPLYSLYLFFVDTRLNLSPIIADKNQTAVFLFKRQQFCYSFDTIRQNSLLSYNI